jgi:hypothetical protein
MMQVPVPPNRAGFSGPGHGKGRRCGTFPFAILQSPFDTLPGSEVHRGPVPYLSAYLAAWREFIPGP